MLAQFKKGITKLHQDLQAEKARSAALEVYIKVISAHCSYRRVGFIARSLGGTHLQEAKHS